jgi:hypothetical protein
MKKLFLLLCFGLLNSIAGNPALYKPIIVPKIEPINPYLRLYEAVCIVESDNNPKAYNTREQATGIVQVRPIRLKDYNQRTGKNYSLTDMYDTNKSKEVFLYYAHKIGHNNLETIARKWNGKGEKTKQYWQRVKSQMNLE